MERQTETAILDALAEHGPASGPEIARMLGAHPMTVERQCAELQRRGRIQQVTGGMYALREVPRVRRGVASD
jgi:DeoR/GlpR family transcriptional regulator of sugar metabolism